MDIDKLGELLSAVEAREIPLLVWGIVGSTISEDELHAIVRDHTNDPGREDEWIEALLERRVLFEDNRRYYTRLSEGLRLLTNVRQLFAGRDWRSAPRLVADYRLSVCKRRFPKRNIAAPDVMEQLKCQTSKYPPIVAQTASALIQADADEKDQWKLARFQVDASRAILGMVAAKKDAGVIVGAGTGSGKTLAFYLPALSVVSGLIERNQYWTKSVAIYPRNELLKDQILETIRETARIDPVLVSQGLRPIVIGAYFGPTPHKASVNMMNSFRWPLHQNGSGYICPYISCPKCGEPMIWRTSDLERGVEALHCPNDCEGGHLGPERVRLTRESLRKQPPDILFTTIETLNRRMSDPAAAGVFGIRVRRTPRIVLLDEVHTYVGTGGAQAAYLLRRWRHAVKTPMVFVGLSATLLDARMYLSRLLGITIDDVNEVSPGGGTGAGGDMESKSQEYRLAVRYNPDSGASVLSTSIQSIMLGRRLLDPLAREGVPPVSEGLFGEKVFVFTDDLDVTNRLYDNYRDAEGIDVVRNRPKGTNAYGAIQYPDADEFRALDMSPLASLRDPDPDPPLGRDQRKTLHAEGQIWRIAEDIGHDLSRYPSARVQGVSRTTSKDAGVERRTDVIVATSSLEVGFNDTRVGMVVQHKAPRNAASFLQRKGRAGRRQITRPVTMVVLSDFGRDRNAYQAYELLLDPVLRAPELPLANRHIQRMQATYAMLDWLTTTVPRNLMKIEWDDLFIWKDLSTPVSRDPNPRDYVVRHRERIRHYITVLRDIREGHTRRRRQLENHLKESLGLNSYQELAPLLWEPPRSLYLEVIPTLLRRLIGGWRMEGSNCQEPHKRDEPLPEYIRPNFFEELNLPDVTISLQDGEPDELETMPILQALNQLAPGRVTRRFSTDQAEEGHWFDPGNNEPNQGDVPRDLEEFCPQDNYVGHFSIVTASGNRVEVPCYRPYSLRLDVLRLPPKGQRRYRVHPLLTSQGQQVWRSEIIAESDGLPMEVPAETTFSNLFSGCWSYLHENNEVIETRRFSLGSEYSIRMSDGKQVRGKFYYRKRGRVAALGYSLNVDGLRFRMRTPESIDLPEAELQILRATYQEELISAGEGLENIDVFTKDNLRQVTHVWLLSKIATGQAESASQLLQGIDLEGFRAGLLEASNLFFNFGLGDTTDFSEPAEEEDAETPTGHVEAPQVTSATSRRQQALIDALGSDPVVTDLLAAASGLTISAGDDGIQAHAKRVLGQTAAGAIFSAWFNVLPDTPDGSIMVDVGSGQAVESSQAEETDIWITESSPGGSGYMTAMTMEYAKDPILFYQSIRAAVAPSDYEHIDHQLRRILGLMESDADVMNSVQEFRRDQMSGEVQRETALKLHGHLRRRGVFLSHPVLQALHARVLRPGSCKETDDFLRNILRYHTALQLRLGFELETRLFAYAVACYPDDELRQAIDALPAAIRPGSEIEINNLALSLLWPLGNRVRSASLMPYNLFAMKPPPAVRTLLARQLSGERHKVLWRKGDWMKEARDTLVNHHQIILVAPASETPNVKLEMLTFLGESIELGFLLVYPWIQGVDIAGESILITFAVQEGK